jgi:hypothetical protein
MGKVRKSVIICNTYPTGTYDTFVIIHQCWNIEFGAGVVRAGAASRYGSGFTKMIRLRLRNTVKTSVLKTYFFLNQKNFARK